MVPPDRYDRQERHAQALGALSRLQPGPRRRGVAQCAAIVARWAVTACLLGGHAWWLCHLLGPEKAQPVVVPESAPLPVAVPITEPQPVVVPEAALPAVVHEEPARLLPPVMPALPAPPAGPVWPWEGVPGWEAAQTHPEAYRRWLQQQNPGYRVEIRRALVTAYTPHERSCGASADGLTAVMKNAWTYGIAVPGPLLGPWRRAGVRVHVPGYMPERFTGRGWIPDDSGGALSSNWGHGVLHVDLRYMHEGWALTHWGKRTGKIFILRKEK